MSSPPGGTTSGAALARAGDAVDAGLAGQAALTGEVWPAEAPIRLRMGLHTGGR